MKKAFFSLIIIFISCLIGILITEGVLQMLKKGDGWAVTNQANIKRNFKAQYNISKLYSSKKSTVNYVRNKYGLRDDCTTSKDIEILTIGGSTTDQIYVSFESTFQKILQERLRLEDINFGCVTNAGIDGHSTWGHIFSFEKWFPLIQDLNPKYILLYVGINDTYFESADRPKLGYDVLVNSSKKNFLKKFEIVQLLMPIYRYLRYYDKQVGFAGHARKTLNKNSYTVTVLNKKVVPISKKNAEAFRIRLKLILNHVKNLEATPICVTQPHRFIIKKGENIYGIPGIVGEGFSGLDYDYLIQELNLVINELCKENTLDLYSHKFSDEHFYDGIHTTDQGSIEIGNTIADFIIERYQF